jgi:hypothetical protein
MQVTDSNGNAYGPLGLEITGPNGRPAMRAFPFPQMTTVQKNAIPSPQGGWVVYDTTLNKLCVYNGTAWETITSL